MVRTTAALVLPSFLSQEFIASRALDHLLMRPLRVNPILCEYASSLAFLYAKKVDFYDSYLAAVNIDVP
jgi:hypothetical protein